MRSLLCLSSLGFLLGCQSAAPVQLGASDPNAGVMVALADAGFIRQPAVTLPAVALSPVLALDPIVAQLLRASFAAYDHQRRVLLENITNVNTTAYKRRFVQMTMQTITGSDGLAYQVPVVQDTTAIFTSGVLQITERNLDVAIDGDGFFAVILLDGSVGYTRNGALQINRDGKLTTSNGCVLLPEMTVPSDLLELSIAPDGRVSGRTAGSPDTSTSFGQWTVHRFVNSAGLRLENGIYGASEASGSPMTGAPGTSGLGVLKQGFLEGSNVQLVKELVDLQILERQHDTLVRMMQQFGMVAP